MTEVPAQETGDYALFGWPLGFSLSPLLFAAACTAAGLTHRYALAPTSPANLATAVGELRRGRWAGANITIPHKLMMRDLVDEESPMVGAIGAVNTVVRLADGRLRGENTDVTGFRALSRSAGLAANQPGKAVIWGAGGGARAAAYVLAELGLSVRILARRSGQAGTTAAQLYRALPGARLATGRLSHDEILRTAATADLVVNATPVGGASDPAGCLWPGSAEWPARPVVLDLVAWPVETVLVKRAREAGCRAHGGLEMLIGQAAEAFWLWTGLRPDENAMRSSVS